MSSPSRWAFDGIFLMNHEKVMPWSRYSWFFCCPKIVTFASLMIFEPCLWNHDQDLIKWWLCAQNKMLTKFLTFDRKMTILPLQLIVKQMELLTVEFGTVSLETWHVDAWQCIEAYGTWLDHWKPQIPWRNQNPNFSWLRKWFDCAILEPFWTIWRSFLTKPWGIWEGKFWGTTVAPVQSS